MPRGFSGRARLFFVAILAAATLLDCRRETKSAEAELLSAYAAQRTRPLKLRLSGFPYAPPPIVTRGEATIALGLQTAAYAVMADPRTPHASASLILGKSADAVAILQSQVKARPTDTAVWNDLAVALYESGQKENDPHTVVRALPAIDRALALAKTSNEAAFNRAAILDALGLRSAAADAWKRFLALDSSTPWAEEARRVLAAAEQPDLLKRWKAVLPELERAAVAGDARAVDAAVRMYPQQIRTWGEGEYLSRWGNLWLDGQKEEAQRTLTIARLFGDRLAAFNGETLLQSAVAVVDGQSVAGLDSLARAHSIYAKARILIAKRNPTEADAPLAEAVRRFSAAGSPMELVALYYHAGIAFDRTDAERAGRYLASIDKQLKPGFRALRAQVLGERARVSGRRDDLYHSLALASEAAEIFDRLGESEGAARSRVATAAMLFSLGRSEEAWRVRRGIFQQASETGSAALLQQSLHNAASAEMRERRFDVARSLLDVLLPLQGPSPLLRFDTRLSRAFAGYRMGERSDEETFGELATIANSITDPALRDEAYDRLRYVEAVLTRATDPDRAIRLLDDSIAFRRRTRRLSRLAEAQFERGQALRSAGALDDAVHELNAALETLEIQRQRVSTEDLRDSFFSSADDICDELASLHQSRGETDKAFSAVDRCRARALLDLDEQTQIAPPATLDDVQRALPDQAGLVLYAALPDRLLIWCVTRSKRASHSMIITRDDIERSAAELRSAIEQRRDGAAQKLIQRLSRFLVLPIENSIGIPPRLIVIADGLLAAVPMSVLQDRNGRPLIETSEISFVPSAAAALHSGLSHSRPDRALVVGNPALAPAAAEALDRLPAAEDEARRIAALYNQATLLLNDAATITRFMDAAPRSDIVHVGAHALMSARDARDSALVLAPSPNDNGMLTLRRIAAMNLAPDSIVVLAGCKTGAFGGGRGAIRSLSYAFLAAGSHSVLASVWDVEDETSLTLSLAFHRRILDGAPPGRALREAQLDMLRSGRPNSHPADWGAFQLYQRN